MKGEHAEAVTIEQIQKIDAGSAPIGVEFFGEIAAFILRERSVLFVPARGDPSTHQLHEGAILSFATDGQRLLTGGDDGRVVAVAETGATERIFTDDKRRWIDRLAASAAGSLAWSAGKQVFYGAAGASQRVSQFPSSVGGLAFSPDDSMIAIAHYNGVALWKRADDEPAAQLSWKGSHLDVSFSPDGRVLVTSMREPALHAWDIPSQKDLPTPVYPKRVRSMDWMTGGRFLATSGADRLTLLSFQVQDNPLARMPLLLAPYRNTVAGVACHPRTEMVAVGYEDGLVLLVRVPDGAEVMVKAPDENAISAMRWNKAGTRLGIASQSGQCRVVTVK